MSEKKLVIVGWSETTRKLAPRGPGFERWACNGGDGGRQFLDDLNIDVWFDMHWWKTRTLRSREWMRDLKKPIYLIENRDEVPTGRQYPFREAWKYIGDRYMTNTIAYMLVLGAMKGFKEIHLYGADMAIGSEYFYQRPNTEYIIGFLRRGGINIVIPFASPICKSSFLYPFEPPPSEAMAKRKVLAKKALADLEKNGVQIPDDVRDRIDKGMNPEKYYPKVSVNEMIEGIGQADECLKASEISEFNDTAEQLFQMAQKEGYKVIVKDKTKINVHLKK